MTTNMKITLGILAVVCFPITLPLAILFSPLLLIYYSMHLSLVPRGAQKSSPREGLMTAWAESKGIDLPRRSRQRP